MTAGRWVGLVILGPLLIWSAIEERNMAAYSNVAGASVKEPEVRPERGASVEELMVSGNTRVKELVHKPRPSKYHVLLVVDRHMNLLAVSETLLLEAFYKGLVDLEVKELIGS